MAQVADAKTGEKAPALEMNYKAANGYSREMEHWMIGSVLGASNATKDNEVHYRSEANLITRAANRHLLIKACITLLRWGSFPLSFLILFNTS